MFQIRHESENICSSVNVMLIHKSYVLTICNICVVNLRIVRDGPLEK